LLMWRTEACILYFKFQSANKVVWLGFKSPESGFSWRFSAKGGWKGGKTPDADMRWCFLSPDSGLSAYLNFWIVWLDDHISGTCAEYLKCPDKEVGWKVEITKFYNYMSRDIDVPMDITFYILYLRSWEWQNKEMYIFTTYKRAL
jgi:hypothetical protein